MLLMDARHGTLWRHAEPNESPRKPPDQLLVVGLVTDDFGLSPLLSRYEPVRVDPSGHLEEWSGP